MFQGADVVGAAGLLCGVGLTGEMGGQRVACLSVAQQFGLSSTGVGWGMSRAAFTHPPYRSSAAAAAWEEPFRQQISSIRLAEAAFIRRTAAIKAFNMGLSAAIIPLVRCLMPGLNYAAR